ncbi:MAG: AbrB/MazE/SpoVT family DNA-binding domain-containing protein [Rhizobiales bacterium]|nr:AbrB/MazE/SpoVT family DNA-binding domain-containing protein [Hyphomicrobiales bacterium]
MPTLFKNGRVTIPKKVRDEAGIHPGDTVEVRATASGGAYVEKVSTHSVRSRNAALSKRRSKR